MASEGVSTSSTRMKVSTGYARLDEALQGGFLAGSMVVLNAPASDEVPILLRDFLQAALEESLLICRTLSSAQIVIDSNEGLKSLVCSDKPVPPSKNVIPGKGIDNLTDVNLQITEAVGSLQPKRVVLDILSDGLLRHKALQTRKWLTELLERLRSKNITTLAVLNPYMHSNEDVQAVVDLFDGNLEILEEKVEGTLRKFMRIKWMHGIEVAEKEFLLVDVVPEPQMPTQQVAVTATALKEPRWLTPLISRTAELSKLKTAFENALANRSSVVALQGEVGVGKTRLMQELVVYAQSKNAIALSGSAPEDALPYAPWIEITRQYVAQASGELLRRMLGSNASELVKLVPDIAAKLGTIPPSKSIGEQQDKLRFYEVVTQFFIAVCKDAPLLLLFDDMKYADQSSLDLLEYFVRSTSNRRVLTVCSLPAEHELESTSPLEQVLLKFNKQRLLESVTVKNLNKEDTTNLIKHVFAEQTVSPGFADLIYQRTGGNPFFVEEVLRSLVEDGTIFRTEKGWDRKPIQEIAIPKSVKSTLKTRLARLDEAGIGVLQTAAVIGPEFSFEVLMEVSQTNEDALFTILEKAMSQGLVTEIPREKSKFRFSDSRIRELLLDDLMRVKRARYHLKIAEAMEKTYAKNLESQAEAIAFHFSEGGDTQQGIKYSIMAGDRNRTIHAYQQAINDYRRALDLIGIEEDRKEKNDQERAVIQEKLAHCYHYAGQPQESIRSFEEALKTFEKLNDGAACARAYLGLAKATRMAKGMGLGSREAAQILERGLKYLGQDLEGFDAASIYSKLADNYAIVDEWDEANTWAEKALQVGEKTNNFGAVAEALSMKGSFLTDTGRVDEGLSLWEQAFNLSLQHEEYEEAINCVHNLSIYTYPRDFVKARKLAMQELELSKSVNHVTREASALEYLSYLSWLHGDWDDAVAQLEKAFEIKQRLNLTNIFGTWDQGWKGWLLLCKGELRQAEIELQQAVASPETKITFVVQNNLVMGLIRLEQDRVEAARICFEKCAEVFKNWEFTTMPLLHIESLLHLTSIYSKSEPEKAVMTSRWARRLADQLKSESGNAMASQAEAYVFQAQGDRNAAEAEYLKSLILWKKADWPYYRAKALVAYSEAIAQTKPEESKKGLQEAAEIFKKLGAKRDLEKAQTKLST